MLTMQNKYTKYAKYAKKRNQNMQYTNIQNKGSDTMVNLALAWAEEYQKEKPSVRLSVTGGGSGTGMSALANNTTDIANASRPISTEELAEAKKQSYQAVEFVVARDAIGVIVNPLNPISKLTMVQISQIYKGQIRARMFIFWEQWSAWATPRIPVFFRAIPCYYHPRKALFQK